MGLHYNPVNQEHLRSEHQRSVGSQNQQRGGERDFREVKFMKLDSGVNTIRILPPWSGEGWDAGRFAHRVVTWRHVPPDDKDVVNVRETFPGVGIGMSYGECC